eukprot:6101003-Amphidinium_carterae.1
MGFRNVLVPIFEQFLTHSSFLAVWRVLIGLAKDGFGNFRQVLSQGAARSLSPFATFRVEWFRPLCASQQHKLLPQLPSACRTFTTTVAAATS